MLFYLSQMTTSSSRQSRRRSIGTNSPKGAGSPLLSSPSLWPYTPGPQIRSNPVLMLPQEQDAAPFSPLSPPPRFGAPVSEPLSPHSTLPASSAQNLIGHGTMLYTGLRKRGKSRSSFSDSSYRSSSPDSTIETVSERFDKLQGAALWRSRATTTPVPRIPDHLIPLEAIVNPPPLQTRTSNAKIIASIPPVNPPTRRIKISDTPPQIPISIFADPPSRHSSMVRAIPSSSLAPTFRSSSSASQYESFTPTFGVKPLPPLPATSRRSTYTGFAPSECTPSSSPTSLNSRMEEEEYRLSKYCDDHHCGSCSLNLCNASECVSTRIIQASMAYPNQPNSVTRISDPFPNAEDLP